MNENFEFVWKRIVENQGNDFMKIRGGIFSYVINNENEFIPSVPDNLPKASNKENLEKAYAQWPVKGPSFFSKDIFAPSYVWGLFNDSRIIAKEEK